jgi:hypothetical protein
MMDLLHLSLQYIRRHLGKLLVLTFAITLVSWLPIAIQSIVDQTAGQLRPVIAIPPTHEKEGYCPDGPAELRLGGAPSSDFM